MEIRDILLLMHASQPDHPALGVAAELARGHGAVVEAICRFDDPEMEVADGFAIGPAGVCDVLTRREDRVRELTVRAHDAFTAQLGRAGVGWELLEPGEPLSYAAWRAASADLVVLPRPTPGDHNAIALAESLVLSSGAPCLAVPASSRSGGVFSRILVAWNGSREAKHALDGGMALLKQAPTVEILVVGDPSGWIEHHPGEALIEHLGRHGVRASFRQAPKDQAAAEVVLGECSALGADLLVMGAYGHARSAEVVLGGATRDILLHAPLPVFMVH